MAIPSKAVMINGPYHVSHTPLQIKLVQQGLLFYYYYYYFNGY